MKLSVRSVAISAAILWGGAILLTGIFNRLDPNYGWWFLKVVDSIYPGYEAAFGLKNLVVGVMYGVVDAAICGALFAWIYNMVAVRCSCPSDKERTESAS